MVSLRLPSAPVKPVSQTGAPVPLPPVPESPCPRCAGRGSVPDVSAPGDAVLYVLVSGPDGVLDAGLRLLDLVEGASRDWPEADEDLVIWALYPSSDGRGPRVACVLRPTVAGLAPSYQR